MIMAGSMFATLILVFSKNKFTPTQKISIFPTKERLLSAASVMIGSIPFARSVTDPCKIATGMAEKIQPFPMDAVMTQIIIRSRMALVRSVE